MQRSILILLIVALLMCVLLGLMRHPAHAHSWYPPLCCNGTEEGGDCHPVPCDELVETKSGITWQGHNFNKEQVHPSFDRNCHVCVGPTGISHCVFVEPTS